MENTVTIGKKKALMAEESLKENNYELLKGVRIIRVTEDGSYDALRSILLEDADGRQVEIIGGDGSNRINVILPAPPELVTCYVVNYKIGQFDLQLAFKTEVKARTGARELQGTMETMKGHMVGDSFQPVGTKASISYKDE